MRKAILIISIMLICFGMNVNAITRDKGVIKGISPSITASGTFSMPQKMSSDNYDPSYGVLFSIDGIYPSEQNRKNFISSVSLLLSRDAFLLKDNIAKRTKANISSIQIGTKEYLPLVITNHLVILPYSGGSMGISKFFIPEKTYNNLNGLTLTELKEENGNIQSSNCRQVGVQASIKDIIPGIDLGSIIYSYDVIAIEKAWMPWHGAISAVIFSLITTIIDAFGDLSPNSTALGLIVMGAKAGASILWYNFDYSHHNWPFKDHKPLRYNRRSLSINFAF